MKKELITLLQGLAAGMKKVAELSAQEIAQSKQAAAPQVSQEEVAARLTKAKGALTKLASFGLIEPDTIEAHTASIVGSHDLALDCLVETVGALKVAGSPAASSLGSPVSTSKTAQAAAPATPRLRC